MHRKIVQVIRLEGMFKIPWTHELFCSFHAHHTPGIGLFKCLYLFFGILLNKALEFPVTQANDKPKSKYQRSVSCLNLAEERPTIQPNAENHSKQIRDCTWWDWLAERARNT